MPEVPLCSLRTVHVADAGRSTRRMARLLRNQMLYRGAMALPGSGARLTAEK